VESALSKHGARVMRCEHVTILEETPRWDPARPAIESIVTTSRRRRHRPEAELASLLCRKFQMSGEVCEGTRCRNRHHFIDDEEEAQATRLRERRQQVLSQEAHPDDVAAHEKVDKKLRDRTFVEWLVGTFGRERLNSGTGVLDIAGGKGALGYELWMNHRIRCTLVDPVPRQLSKHCRKMLRKNDAAEGLPVVAAMFDEHFADEPGRKALLEGASVLVGMHPDQATEAIVQGALDAGKPFAVVPCCVFHTLAPHRRTPRGEPVLSTAQFIEYLAAKSPACCTASLQFAGRNRVVYHSGAKENPCEVQWQCQQCVIPQAP